MDESELAIWLTQNHADVPLMELKVYWHLGDWTLSGYIPVSNWGIIEVDFILDTCHRWKGFELSDANFKFNSNVSHSMMAIGKLSGIIERGVAKFMDFMGNIPNKN